MRLAILMRTADRGAGRNYVASTMKQLREQGVGADTIHLFPTSQELKWLPVGARESCVCHVPPKSYTATENMGVCLSNAPDADWVIHLEDDVRICHDFMGSVERWIQAHADPYLIASFFTPQSPEAMGKAMHEGAPAVVLPVGKLNSAVALALRPADARACGAWITSAAPAWRTGSGYPAWAHRRGADKMIAAWHQSAYPFQPNLIAAVPDFVQHEGSVSNLRGLGSFRYVRSTRFTGQAWGTA